MSAISKEKELKNIIKSAVSEALEDFAFGKAIKEGEKSKTIAENKINKVITKK
ncbi:MAG: hypothetical protein KKH98_04380 [Spirochaetes bacterium]|nr:hypothetical protein [Spirochaetota bacterium]